MPCWLLKRPFVTGVQQQLWPRRNNLTAKRCRPVLQNLLGSRKNWSPRALEGSQTLTNGDASGRRRIAIATTGGEGEEEVKSESLEAILVLAGGQLPGGGLPVWVERRLDKALQLQKLNGPECRIVCLGNGTPYRRPLLTPEGFVIHESSSCAEYLIRKGVPVSVLLKEWGSYDTIGNGFFALTQHAIPRRWRRMAVVTSDFHMPRSRAIFEWVFGLQGAGTSIQPQANNRPVVYFTTSGSRSQGFILQYHSVSDDGIDPSIIEARRVKERKSLENLMILSPGISTLSDFHAWFHAEHKCYNVEDQGLFGKQTLDDPALQSY